MKKLSSLLVFCMVFFAVSACTAQKSSDKKKTEETSFETVKLTEEQLAEFETAYFAAGCFWCVEEIYQRIEGVKQAVSGFAGGNQPNPTYREVAMGKTNYAETVRVRFDPDVVTYRQLVKVFYASHNPTLLNKVGPDEGPQYRSAIFYVSEKQKKIASALKSKIDASGRYEEPIVTEIAKLKHFYATSEHHQNYERKNPNDPYIVNVSQPRIQRTLDQFPKLVEEKYRN